jgi:hypothetical protein
MSYPVNTLARAMLNVEPDLNSGCWLWSGGMLKSGYGRTAYRNRGVMAHRFIYEQTRGTIPRGFMALHKCDTPSCVNPDHIFLGTAAHNAADCAAKGRLNTPRGEDHGCAKLTAAEVKEIRDLARLRVMPQSRIATDYGISQANVSLIKNGHGWVSA